MSDKYWFNLEERTLGSIRMHVFDEIYYSVLHMKSSSALWVKFESKYMTKSLTRKVYLKRQLYYLWMSDFDSL